MSREGALKVCQRDVGQTLAGRGWGKTVATAGGENQPLSSLGLCHTVTLLNTGFFQNLSWGGGNITSVEILQLSRTLQLRVGGLASANMSIA